MIITSIAIGWICISVIMAIIVGRMIQYAKGEQYEDNRWKGMCNINSSYAINGSNINDNSINRIDAINAVYRVE